MHKLVEVFCDVDDFCAVFIPEWEKTLLTDGTRKRQGTGRMTMSEVMTIIIFFQISHHRDFKNFYIGYLAHFYKSAFPNLLSYIRFLEVMPTALVPLCSYFASLKSDPTGIEFVDSTSIKVCHNLRIHRHKTLASALVGVAPMNKESGRFKGMRKIQGGRHQVRTVLYMAMMSAIQSNPVF